MSQSYSAALGISHFLLRILRVLNLAVGAGIVVCFVASFIFEPAFIAFFGKDPARLNPGLLMGALRFWVVLALPAIAAVHIQLSRLLAIVETVRLGDPFLPENAVRMKTIAWCQLLLQLMNLCSGVMVTIVNAAGSKMDWTFSAAGWVAVVLLFVLARVFEEGARIRGDLEAMV